MIASQREPRKTFLDPDYRGAINRTKDNLVCCRCQKPITSKDYRLAFTDGMQVIHPTDAYMLHGKKGYVWAPIGNECAKIIGVDFTYLLKI